MDLCQRPRHGRTRPNCIGSSIRSLPKCRKGGTRGSRVRLIGVGTLFLGGQGGIRSGHS